MKQLLYIAIFSCMYTCAREQLPVFYKTRAAVEIMRKLIQRDVITNPPTVHTALYGIYQSLVNAHAEGQEFVSKEVVIYPLQKLGAAGCIDNVLYELEPALGQIK